MGLRARLTAATTVVVAVGLLAGSLLVVLALRVALLSGLDEGGRARARGVAELVTQDRLPSTLPAGAGLVQVVDADQRVLAASPGTDRLVPLLGGADVTAVRGGATRELPGAQVAQDDPLRVVGLAAGTPADPLTVLVASSLAQVDDSTRVVRRGLLVGAPLLLLVVAALAWWLVGSVLRPVEQLRRGAARIRDDPGAPPTRDGDRDRRLPVPPGTDELHRLATTLNEMLDRLADSAARQREFVADAAHELRSPLASARTQLEVLLAHPAGADWPGTAADVLTDVERLARLVDDLLLLARTDAGVRANRRDVDLARLASDAVDALGRGADRVRTDPEVDPDPGPRVRLAPGSAGVVPGDPVALGRVVSNLLENAVRHAAHEVVVDVRADGGRVRLTVDDDGPGIDPADRSRVLERFTRLDPARGRDAGGTGLGLSIVQRLVVAHEGTLALDRSPAGGLRAVVVLPAVAG